MSDKPQLEDWRVTAERVYQERQQRQATMTEEAPLTRGTSSPVPQQPRDESPILKWWHGMTSRGRGLTIGAAIGLALIGLAQFGEPPSEPTKSDAPAPAPVQREEPKAAPEPAPAPQPRPAPEVVAQPAPPPPPRPATLEEELRKQYIEVKSVNVEDTDIQVIFKVSDNLTANLRRVGAQKDVLTIMETTHRLHPGKHLTVRGDFPLLDKYGNESEGIVLLLNYSPATLARVNYDNILVRENVFDLADASPKMIHPDLQGRG